MKEKIARMLHQVYLNDGIALDFDNFDTMPEKTKESFLNDAEKIMAVYSEHIKYLIHLSKIVTNHLMAPENKEAMEYSMKLTKALEGLRDD